MRLISFIVFCIFFFHASAQDMEALIKGEREAFIQKSNIKTKRSGKEYDVVYQHLKLEVIPDVRNISGSVVTSVVAKESAFDQFSLDLDTRMAVDSVKQGSSQLIFTHANDEVLITIPSINVNDMATVEIFYSGNPTENEQRGFSYDWHMTGPIAWSLSEPYGAYGWWPNKQSLTDKIDSFDMSIKVPDYAKAAGLGLLTSVDTIGDTSLVFNWKHRYPVVPYLVAVTVTNFYEESHYIQLPGGDSVLHMDFLYPEYKPEADTLRRNIDGMMFLFDSLFGDYPFKKEKYGHAQFGRGGGMEHQTMSSMANLNYTLMAHELAHQWFGNKITCGSWQDLWLNEGFATYLAAIAYEFLQPREKWEEYMNVMIRRSNLARDGSVFAYDTLDVGYLFNGNLRYRKAGMVLHMLRWELGDEDFFKGVRDYTAAESLCYDFARTADLQFYLEQASGKDLTTFFDQWVYKQGHPILKNTWTRKSDGTLQLDLDQITSNATVNFFPLNLQFRAIGQGGNKDTLFVVEHRNRIETINVDLGFQVTELVFDPNLWLAVEDTLIEGNHEDLSGVTIFPNPSENSITFYSKETFIQSYEIIDLQGRVLISEEFDSDLKRIDDIDISYFTNGVYFLRAKSGDNTLITKFIKTAF